MARQKKDGKTITHYVDREIVELLEKYAEIKGQTRTKALELILGEYLNNYFKQHPDQKK